MSGIRFESSIIGGLWMLDENHVPYHPETVLEWGKWYESAIAECRVGADRFEGFFVSTVFTGIDLMADIFNREPLLFETVVFDESASEGTMRRPLDMKGQRYHTWDEAVAGHAKFVAMVRAAYPGGENGGRPTAGSASEAEEKAIAPEQGERAIGTDSSPRDNEDPRRSETDPRAPNGTG